MPIQRPPTPEEAQYLQSQGIDPRGFLVDDDSQEEQPQNKGNGITSTIAKTIEAHAGGWLGGGAGMTGALSLGGALLGPETMGAGFLVPGVIAAAGGMAGGLGGQKLQEYVGGSGQEELEKEAEEARKEHPYVAGATDIAGSALAGGGELSLGNLKSVGKQLLGRNALSSVDEAALRDLGESALGTEGTENLAGQTEGKEALGKIFGSAVLNPAINTGLDLATGQSITPGGIASQVTGGALFSEQSRLGKMLTGHADEPLPETASKDITTQPTDSGMSGDSVFNQKDESGNYSLSDALVKQEFLKNNITSKSDLSKLPRTEALLAQQQNSNHRANTDYDSMRSTLHAAEIDSQKNINKPTDIQQGATIPTQPESTIPNVTDDNKVSFAPEDNGARDKAIQDAIDDTKRREVLATQSDPAATITGHKPFNALNDNPKPAASSPETTSNMAAESAARQSALLTSIKNYNKSLTSGEGITQAKSNMEAEQQRFAYHMQEMARVPSGQPVADAVKQHSIDEINAQKQAAIQKSIDDKNATDLQKPRQPLNPDPSNMLRIINPKTLLPQDLSSTTGVHTFENIDNWLAYKKVDTNGKIYDAMQGIPISIWNGSIDAIRLGIKAGKAIHEAIKDGIAHIKANWKGKFDEDAFTKEMIAKQEGEQGLPFGTTSGKEVIPSINRMGKLGRVTEALYDKISDLPHTSARSVANAFKLTDNTKDQYFGESWGKIKSVMDKVGFTKKDGEQLDRISDWENLNHKSAPQEFFKTRAQRAVYNIERQVYDETGKRRIINNQPVYRNGKPTTLRQDSTAHPTPLAPKIAEMYKAGTDTEGIAKHDADFIANEKAHGYTPDKAAKLLDDFKSTIQGTMKKNSSNMSFFGGSRLSQGVPLPRSFTKGGYANRLESYYRRLSLDNAFYKHVESNPEVMSALGETKDAWGKPISQMSNTIANNDDVRTALNTFQGEATDTTSRTEGSITNLASTLFVSNPVIEMHKILSNTLNGAISLADNPVEAARTFAHMITHLSDGIEHATENGLIKMTAKSVGDFFDSNATAAERLQAASQGWRNISSVGGRTDKINNGLMQAGFESAIPGKIALANKGNITYQQLLKKWDPTYTVGKTYSTKEVQQLASIAAGYVHGTKDGRTMPPWMMKDTELSGFFKLAHWSISQTNRFMSDVYTPATKGNMTPLVNALLGSAVGGYVIRELREKLQGKHGEIPDLKEIAASEGALQGNKGLVAYNLISALQYAGFAGIISQGIKTPVDVIYKNLPQGAVFPLDEISTDLLSHIGKLTSAATNDPNFKWGDAAVAFWNHILTSDIQLTRVAFNQGVNSGIITGMQADKKVLSDKLGQLRRFDITTGLPYDDQEINQSNPYMNIEQKKFKNEQNLDVAMKELPGLIDNIFTTYGDKPDIMMSKLKALKENSYETFPSLQDKAPSFVKYMNYLERLKGKNDADSEYMNYLQHKITNEAKASAVP